MNEESFNMKLIIITLAALLLTAVLSAFASCGQEAGSVGDTATDGTSEGTQADTERTAALTEGSGTADQIETVEFSWKNGRKTPIRSGSWAPRVYTLPSGELISGYETSSGIKTMISTDNGVTWKGEASASFKPDKNCANVNFFLFDGKLYLAYRATGDQSDGFYTSLQVSVSDDLGRTWAHHSTVCEYVEPSHKFKGVWEPCLGEIDGTLTCFYANDFPSVTSMQNIESMTWAGDKWSERTVVFDGKSHDSRDGMPVWIRLSDGTYAMVFESTHYRKNGNPFVIRLSLSSDGKKWSSPQNVYIPKTSGSKAGAPGIVELPTGQLVISFQTDEDASVKGDSTSVMKTVISDGTAYRKLNVSHFSASDNVFGTPDGESSTWTGIWYSGGYLYASAGTRSGSSLNVIRVIEE